jgi:hypothetical protein
MGLFKLPRVTQHDGPAPGCTGDEKGILAALRGCGGTLGCDPRQVRLADPVQHAGRDPVGQAEQPERLRVLADGDRTVGVAHQTWEHRSEVAPPLGLGVAKGALHGSGKSPDMDGLLLAGVPGAAHHHRADRRNPLRCRSDGAGVTGRARFGEERGREQEHRLDPQDLRDVHDRREPFHRSAPPFDLAQPLLAAPEQPGKHSLSEAATLAVEGDALSHGGFGCQGHGPRIGRHGNIKIDPGDPNDL